MNPTVICAHSAGGLLGKTTLDLGECDFLGSCPSATLDVDVTGLDQLYLELSSRDPDIPSMLGSYSFLTIHGITPGALYYPETATILPQPYRGWNAFGYNGNRARATQVITITPEDLTYASQFGEAQMGQLEQDIRDAVNDQQVNEDLFTPSEQIVFAYLPKLTQQRWESADNNAWVGAGVLSSSRLGPDHIAVPTADELASARVVPRISRTDEIAFSGGVSVLSASFSDSNVQGILDFMDLNGDLFPDVLGSGTVQYSPAIGGLESAARAVDGFASAIRETDAGAFSFGVGGNYAHTAGNGKGRVDTRAQRGGRGSTGQQMASLGVSATVTEGASDIEFDLQDINADGLPDRVFWDSGNLQVAFNLGYRFAEKEAWSTDEINHGESEALALGASVGFNDGIYGFGGGINLSRNESVSLRSLIDINGDGLLDRVSVSDGNGANQIMLGINTGNGFMPDVVWPIAQSRGMALSTTTDEGAGGYFTIGIGPLCLVGCYIITNPGADVSQSMSRVETSISDIDGDGYPDYLYSVSDDVLQVSTGQIGRSNLLRHVERPLGASIDLSYERTGNTYAQPYNHWVMARVEVNDGFAGDGVDTQLITYQYLDGFYNRQEREFYGFAQVITEQRDVSQSEALYRQITQDYENGNYYEKGLLLRELLADASGNPFTETINQYQLRDIDTGSILIGEAKTSLTATAFPALIRTDMNFYEGQATPGKTTYMTYAYDPLGNLTDYFDVADSGAADDIQSQINYHQDLANYIVGKANSVIVSSNGATLRRREANFEIGTGNLLQHRALLADNSAAVHDFSYDLFGNLTQGIGAANLHNERYRLDYQYDSATQTYVARVADSFGYVSTASYDARWGEIVQSIDLNAQQIDYSYDNTGRMASVTGPYQQATGHATIEFTYHPEASVPWALTQHFDEYEDQTDPIEIALFIDGLTRVLQTKKDSTLHTGVDTDSLDQMTVAGRITFDHVGRTVTQHYPVLEPLGNPGLFNPSFDDVQATVMDYDVLDRNIRTTIPDNTRTTQAYGFGPDRSGQTQFETVVTDANSNQKRSYRDVRELIVSVKEFNVQGGQPELWSSYVYNPIRELTTVTDDQYHVTTVGYDDFGRREFIDNPDVGRIQYDYDLASNLTQKITATLAETSEAITYDYQFTRLHAITYPRFPQNNVTYSYGGPGASDNRANRITRVTDESGSEERFYGRLGETLKTIKSVVTHQTPNEPEVYSTEYVFDTWNRLQQMTYPDGEILSYNYDGGGLLKDASGIKGSYHYDYIERLEYDKFEQRLFVEVSNGVSTTYDYDPLDRRLSTLQAGIGSDLFQDLAYTYDDVGNLLRSQNLAAVTSPSQLGGATDQHYSYDDLYRLTGATGTFDFEPRKQHQYRLDVSYDTIHNITFKDQVHDLRQPNGKLVSQRGTSYVWDYDYAGPQPHAPTHIGDRSFSYDADGNQLGWEHDDNGTQRTLVWDEENRIQSIFNNGQENSYTYNDTGERVIKRGPQGETVYINHYFTMRNSEIGTKHIFAGATRVLSKLVKPDNTQEADLYFYHPNHLGTGYVTDAAGDIYQHIEYFPFGETWVEQASNTQRTPYLFSAKEFDEETGLYYYGERYYDPRTNVWQSADPKLGN